MLWCWCFMVQWCNGAMVQWRNGAMVQCWKHAGNNLIQFYCICSLEVTCETLSVVAGTLARPSKISFDFLFLKLSIFCLILTDMQISIILFNLDSKMLQKNQIDKLAGEWRNLPNNRGTSCWRGGRQKCPQSDAQVAFSFSLCLFCLWLCLFLFVMSPYHSSLWSKVIMSCLLITHHSSVITHHLKVTSILWISTVAECSTTVDNSPSRLFMFLQN